MDTIELLKSLGVSDSDIANIISFVQTQVVKSAIKTKDSASSDSYNKNAAQQAIEQFQSAGELPADTSILIQEKALASVTPKLVAEMLTEMAQRILINSGVPPIQAGNLVNIESKIKLSKRQNKGDLDKLNQTEKLFGETVIYLSKTIFNSNPTANMESIETILATDEIQSLVIPKSPIELLDKFNEQTGNIIKNKQDNVIDGYLIDPNTSVYLTEGSKQGFFLEQAGILFAKDPTYFFEKYNNDPEWQRGFLRYWDNIDQTALADEINKTNPQFSLGIGDILQGVVNDETNFSWVGTILGPIAGEEYATTYPMSKDEYSIFRSQIPFQSYSDFVSKSGSYDQSFKAVEDILDKEFQVDSSYITESDKANLAQRFRTNAPNITFAQFAQNGGQVGNVVFGVDDFMESLYPDIVAKKDTENIISNKTGYQDAFNKFINPENRNINQTLKALDVAIPGQSKVLQEQFNNAISNYLRNNALSPDINADIARAKILETMGVTPQGDLKPLPTYYFNSIVDPNTNKILGTEGDELEESTQEKFDPQKFHPNYIPPSTGSIETNKLQEIQAQQAIQNAFRSNRTPSETIAGQYGVLPPSAPSSLLGGAPGLPGFIVVPNPVYEDQDVLQIISNRYYDRPELVQFLSMQIPEIAQAFRLSQSAGNLLQDTFGTFEEGTVTRVAGQGVDGTGIEVDGTKYAPGETFEIKTSVPDEYGPGIDDPTSAAAAYSYFERDRPKSIQSFINREASKYESAFETYHCLYKNKND